MAEQSYDLVVVGAGPGGYVAAIRAAQLGLRAAVVEREHLGGICLNWGCIPTKALLRSAEVYHLAERAKEFGFEVDGVRFDAKKMVQRSRKVAQRLNNGVGHLLKKNKVDVVDGHGRLLGGGRVAVEKDGKPVAELGAAHIILATGARARELPGMAADGKLIWTYKHAMVPEAVPGSLLVIGSGAIGIEFASFYRTLGAEVTVVEMLDRILPVEDEEISAFAHKAFQKQGMNLFTSAQVKQLVPGGGIEHGLNHAVGLAQGDGLAVADERKAPDLDLVAGAQRRRFGQADAGDLRRAIGTARDAAGIERMHPGDTGDLLHADQPFMTGLVGEPGRTDEVADGVDPGLVRTQPLVDDDMAAVDLHLGVLEADALDVADDTDCDDDPVDAQLLLVARVLDAGCDLAATGELLGAHMVGAEVTELIQGFAVAKTLETTEAELMHTVFPHPTLSEMMHESVLDAYGRTIHF